MKKIFAGLATAVLVVMATAGAALIGDSVNWSGVSHNAVASVNWSGAQQPNSVNWSGAQGTQASVNWSGAEQLNSVNWS